MPTLVRNGSARRWARGGVTALGLLGAVALPSVARGAQVCFPTPIGVPGLFGPPSWNPPAGSTDVVRKDLNEPRWSASPLVNFPNDPGNAPTGEGGIRLILSPDQTELSVSIQQKADSAAETADGAYFGLYVPGGNGYAVKVPVYSGTADPFIYSGQETAFTYVSGTNWSSSLSQPRWIKAGSLGSWTHQSISAGGADWAIQFKVDLTKFNITSATSFKMFVGMHKEDQGATVDVTMPATPPTSTNPVLIPNTIIVGDPSTWLLVPTLAAGCPLGIAFTSNTQIGTNNPGQADQSAINTTDGGINTFFATPGTNGVSVGKNQLNARFRIANWGAEIADPDAGWTTIIDGAAVTNTAANPVNNTINFQFSCPRNSGGNVCGAPLPSGSLNDQCMLVELSNAPGYSTPISTASIYRNMSFQSLSTKILPADISIKGLQALTGVARARDVYIDVITRNMPPLGNIPVVFDSLLLNLLKSAALGLVAAVDPLADSLSLDDQLKVAWPTYEVHVYYDTGRVNTLSGHTYQVLSPMNSFGYYFSHSGSLFGFTTAIGGVGSTLVQALGPNVYRVRVPNEGTVRVQAGVTAEELPQFSVPAGDRTCQIFPWAAACQ